MYTIVDIETTGGSYQYDRITEIAVYVHDGEKITDEFTTLINPERSIPYFITALTGITNDMVVDAPKFYEVAREIVELTEGKIFVAHNANFDYQFIRQEFKSLGFNFKRKVLCTVKLCRKIMPGLRSYSLGNLCNELNIRIETRHRAAGDARATAALFKLLLSLNRDTCSLITNNGFPGINPVLDTRVIEDLSEETGIYYFYDENGEIIYIGKSRNIRQRVLTHLKNNSSKRAMEMKEKIADIGYEITGSELIALIIESYEIKKIKPLYNRSQRRTSFYYGIYSRLNEGGYTCFSIEKNTSCETPLTCFSSLEMAKKHMSLLMEKFQLCQKFCGLYESQGACFHHQIGICHGACTGTESPADYNKRARSAVESFEYLHRNFFIIDAGRNENERSVVKIENGKFIGYGYADINEIGFGTDPFHDCIKTHQDNRDIQYIIKGYLKRNRVEKILPF
ncbi:MAG: GIY-YIG nuclease family protein [Bacteroidales bacterium]|nr:MAG: GIY-YIG nuclease family protein [Bacteroidales bacterium]